MEIEFVTYSNGYFSIQDYAYHIILAKAFWFDGFGNIYDPYFQQQVLSTHVGSKINTVMPLGITPIALVVWLPFAYVARFSLALSYSFWIAFSVGVLFTALWKIGRYVLQGERQQLVPIVLSFITIFSAIMFRTLYLGQTSVLAAGLLVHLTFFVHRAADQPKSTNWLVIPLLIFILGTKPPYIVLGMGLLMIFGMWWKAFYSVVFVIIVLIAVTPKLTVEWTSSYLNLLQMYSMGDIPQIYTGSIKPHTMNIFRSAFRNMISDNLASVISIVITYGVFLGVVGYTLLAKTRGRTPNQLSLLRITKGQLFIILVASYVLFAPYAGGYEDLLLIPVFIMVLLVGDAPNLTDYRSLALFFLLFLISTHSFFPPGKPLWLFWILKAVMLGYMVTFCRSQGQRRR
jgi:hypothetical protein